jgi:hypothetical protein
MERGCGLDVIPHSLDCLKIKNEPGIVVLKTVAIQSEIRLRIEGIRPNQTLEVIAIPVAILISIGLKVLGLINPLPNITQAISIKIKDAKTGAGQNPQSQQAFREASCSGGFETNSWTGKHSARP